MENFIGLISNQNLWKITTTKFEREVGDKMVIDKINFIVIATGSKKEVTSIVNSTVTRVRQHHANGKKVTFPEGRVAVRQALVEINK